MSLFTFSPSPWITNVSGSNPISILSILITFLVLCSVPPRTPYRAVARICLPHLQIIIFNALSLNTMLHILGGRSQWPRDLRHRSVVAGLLEMWVRIPSVEWMCCLLWVLCVVRESSLRQADYSSREIRLWCAFLCDLATSRLRRP